MKAACPLPERPVRVDGMQGHPYVECDRWRTATLERVEALRPGLVLVSQSDEISQRDSTPAQYAEGTVATLDRLRGAGLDVAYLLDNPHPEADVPACLPANLDDVPACTVPADGSNAPERRDALGRALEDAGITTVDPRPWLCSAQRCPAVAGGMLVYRDNNHVTATYSRRLAPVVGRTLDDLGG